MKFLPSVLLLLFCFTTSKRQQIIIFYFHNRNWYCASQYTIIMLPESEFPALQALLILF